MCFSSPDVKTPDPVQEQKAPDYADVTKLRKKNATLGNGTLLTGPSGISLQSNQMGQGTLLGS
jgi:hypothetical protein